LEGISWLLAYYAEVKLLVFNSYESIRQNLHFLTRKYIYHEFHSIKNDLIFFKDEEFASKWYSPKTKDTERLSKVTVNISQSLSSSFYVI